MSFCVLDTGVVIAALDRSDARHRDAAKAIPAMIEERIELLVSTVNYAEALVRPAENEGTLRTAVTAIAALGLRPTAPTAAIARDAARWRGSLKISLADGFWLATARARSASLASFDRRVRRAASRLGLTPESALVTESSPRPRARRGSPARQDHAGRRGAAGEQRYRDLDVRARAVADRSAPDPITGTGRTIATAFV